MPDLSLVSFRMSFGLFGCVCFIWSQVRSPLWGASTPSKMVSGTTSPSTTDLTALSAVSLCSTSVWDLTFPMCVFRFLESMFRSSWYVRCRRSLCRFCLYVAVPIVWLRIVLMQNELFVRILMWFSVFSCWSATAMAASFPLFFVCLSGCYLMSTCVMVFVFGLTILAPRVGLPLTCEPSV